jgi:uncharacterized C2H2 Zn-finger protein
MSALQESTENKENNSINNSINNNDENINDNQSINNDFHYTEDNNNNINIIKSNLLIKDNNKNKKFLNKKHRRQNNNNNNDNIPKLNLPLVTKEVFKEFLINLNSENSNKNDDEIEKEYNDYKNRYINRLKTNFYNKHKDDEWFNEKFDPIKFNKIKNIFENLYQNLYKNFEENYKNNNFNLIDFDFNENIEKQINEDNNNFFIFKIYKEIFNIEKNEFEEIELNSNNKENNNNNEIKNNNEKDNNNLNHNNQEKYEKIISKYYSSPFYLFNINNNSLFIQYLPYNVSFLSLHSIIKELPGLIFISISEPLKKDDYSRFIWLNFDNEKNVTNALEKLNLYEINENYILNVVKSNKFPLRKIKLFPVYVNNNNNENDFIEEDEIKNCEEIIKKFDLLRNIKFNVILNEKEKINNKKKYFDLMILYLRKIHGFCYYCVKYFYDEKNLDYKCDSVHLRNIIINNNDIENINLYKKIFNENVKNFIENFDKNFNDFENFDEKFIEENFNNLKEKNFNENIHQNSENEFECGVCGKFFENKEYIEKHFNKFHIFEFDNDEFCEEIKKKNYFKDNENFGINIKIINDFKEYNEACDKENNNKENYNNLEHKLKYKDYDDPEYNNKNKKNIDDNEEFNYDDL